MKICLKNQIHKISKLPDNFQALLAITSTMYSHQLPAKWVYYYLDNTGDQILISSDEDYKDMQETLPQDYLQSIKVHIIPLDDWDVPILPDPKEAQQEEQSIILTQSSNVQGDEQLKQSAPEDKPKPKEEANAEVNADDKKDEVAKIQAKFNRRTKFETTYHCFTTPTQSQN